MHLKICESDVLITISEYLALKNIIHWRQNAGAMHKKDRYIQFARWMYPQSTKIREYSFLDLAGILSDGRFFVIEVKRPGETPTKAQLNTIELINMKDGIAFWANSLEMMIEKFKKRGVKL